MIEEDVQRLEEQLEETKKSLARVGEAFAVAFGNDSAVQIHLLRNDLASKERLIASYQDAQSGIAKEVLAALKVLNPHHAGGWRKGELLEAATKAMARKRR